ncbi:hypothetical protein LTR38_015097 [Friedmanniomyces endolithicus]|nr:hypothetical protein LTR38_015097 [Friedmanniomyces endolithicus]
MEQQWTSRCGSTATLCKSPSSSSTSSTTSLKQHIDIPRRVSDALDARGFNVSSEGLVTFQDSSRSHPRNWSLLRKSYDAGLICFLEFWMTLVSNTGSATSEAARDELGISREMGVFCFVTVYMLGQALGGLVLPPMAESFGGRTIYVVSTLLFGVCCLVIALVPTLPAIVACRALSGVLSAMPAVVAAGSLENMFDARGRIYLIHLWISGAVLGLALAPPFATYISASSLRWPTVYAIAAIVTFACTLLCLLMEESRPSQVLHQQVRKVSKQVDFDQLSADGATLPTISEFVRTSLWQPIRLFTEPIVGAVSIMAATVYGIIYLFSDALPTIYIDDFGLGAQPASLVFLAIALGIPRTFLPRIYDTRIANKIQKLGRQIEPEDKLFGFYIAAPVLAISLWWFASTVPPLIPTISPWVSVASLALIGFGVVEFDNVLSGYLTDSYTSYAASANAPMAFLRAVLSGVFPLIGRRMFSKLGNNNALFLLAALATCFCGVAVWFAFQGKQLRQRSPFASESRKTLEHRSETYLAEKSGRVPPSPESVTVTLDYMASPVQRSSRPAPADGALSIIIVMMMSRVESCSQARVKLHVAAVYSAYVTVLRTNTSRSNVNTQYTRVTHPLLHASQGSHRNDFITLVPTRLTMTTRRHITKVEIPIPPSSNGSASSSNKLDLPPPNNWPFLPTVLESLLIAIYPTTLLLGSVFSTLHPATRAATYNPVSQSYDPADAPSYFAKKSNLFNVYFVKIGWVWITLAFFLFVFTHSSLGPPLRPALTKRRLQAILRYACITAVWIAVTQWFFGPPIIDRGFRWTGGKCELVYDDSFAARAEKADMSDAEKVFTHAACKTIGGQWKGGHDISGHVFLLILGSATLWLELLPAMLRMEGLREARRILTSDGLVRSAAFETDDNAGGNMKVPEETHIGVTVALVVAGMSWWMLLMTAAYFHTWFEKFTGLLVAFSAVYTVYFLPRALPPWRQVVGMPGV